MTSKKKPQIKKNKQVKTNSYKSVNPGFSLDPYTLSDDLKLELKEKGLVGRFINIDFIKDNGGQHPRGWRPYKREVEDQSGYSTIFGKDPDGYIRRGQSVLGVKTKEEVEMHKAFLAQEANRHSYKSQKKRSKQELHDIVRQYGLEKDVRILDGYDDE